MSIFYLKELDEDLRYYVDLFYISSEFCSCSDCIDFRDYDENYDKYCNGIAAMTASGISVSFYVQVAVLSVCSVIVGSCVLLMPLYHIKDCKRKPCKKLVKKGICLHIMNFCLCSAFIIYIVLTYTLYLSIEVESIKGASGGSLLVAAYIILFGAYMIYFLRYKKELSRIKGRGRL